MPLLFNNNLLTKYDIPTLLFNDNKLTKKQKIISFNRPSSLPTKQKTGSSIRTIQHSNH